jgi:hypothetical protein
VSKSVRADFTLEEVDLASLHPETVQALRASAHRNHRAVQEEAEYIIKTHLAEHADNQD